MTTAEVLDLQAGGTIFISYRLDIAAAEMKLLIRSEALQKSAR